MIKITIFMLSQALAFYFLHFLYFIPISFVIFFLFIFSDLRYSFKIYPLYLLTLIQGRNMKVLTDYKEIKRVMKYADKGRGIEELISQDGFSPILSIESMNGHPWEQLKKNFLIFTDYTPSLGKLLYLSNQEAKRLKSLGEQIDAPTISKSTIKIFMQWVFCENHLPCAKKVPSENSSTVPEEVKEEDLCFLNSNIKSDTFEKLYESSLEYRKHIALKGYGCPLRKQFALDSVLEILLKSKYKEIPNFDWKDPLVFSVVMQPYIVSPMINISDISVAVKKHLDEYNEKTYPQILDYVDYCISRNHPFPILERYEKETNTTYFIETDTLYQTCKFDPTVLNYGMGARPCLGRVIARTFMEGFFKPMLEKDASNLFKPEIMHLYSGRDNDSNMSLGETLFQVGRMVSVLYKEFIRFRVKGMKE